MDMYEINRITDMLNSKDQEMQDLGVTLCGRSTTGEHYGAYRQYVIHTCKEDLCEEAFKLGGEYANQLKVDDGRDKEDKPDALVTGRRVKKPGEDIPKSPPKRNGKSP